MKKLLFVLLGLTSLNVYANGCAGEYQPATGTCRIIDSSGRQILYNVGSPQSSNNGSAQSQPKVVKIENFRSIAEQKSIVLTPDSHVDELAENVAVQGEHRYFRTAAIYGANSSGKSNMVLGLGMMKHLVDSSVKMNNEEALPYEPFALNAEKAQSPTLYELDFLTGGEHYRYGFTHTAQEICEEWLIRIDEAGKATKLFDRDEEGIGVNEVDFAEGKDLEERTNDNRLFLSLVGQLGGEISNQILGFFSKQLNVLSGLKTERLHLFTGQYLQEQQPGYEQMKEFFHFI